MSEIDQIRERYARRDPEAMAERYSMLNPEVWQAMQERQRAILQMLHAHARLPIRDLRLLEIGCGAGVNLLELLRLGFSPENLIGNELLPNRVLLARRSLPEACNIVSGDALGMEVEAESMDIVFQSTVFSSILDEGFQERLADCMWRWVKPGGCVLWYDFIYNNPNNMDVRGVPLARIRQLFSGSQIDCRRVTLAPPISRRVCRLHPAAYSVLNAFPLLRTHVLCWITKKV